MTEDEDIRSKWLIKTIALRCVYKILHLGFRTSLVHLIPYFVLEMDISYTQAGLLSALNTSVTSFSQPIMRTVARYGINERILALLAGCGTGVAVILSAFTRRFAIMAFLFCVAGFCEGYITFYSVVIMHKYGKHRFPFAHTLTSGLYTLGIGLPFLTYRFYQAYGMSGELLLLGAFLLHGIPIAMLLKPPPNQKCEHVMQELGETSGRTGSVASRTLSKNGYSRLKEVDGCSYDGDDDDDGAETEKKNCELANEDKDEELKGCQDKEEDAQDKSCRRVIFQVLYLNLLLEEKVWSLLILPVAFILTFVLNGWATVIFSFTHSRGIEQGYSVPLLLTGAFGGFSSRLFYSFLLYHNPDLSAFLLLLSTLLLTLSVFLHLLVSSSVVFLYSVSFLFKMALNGATALIPPLTGSSVARNNFACAQSMFELVRGISSLTGGVFTGLLYDYTQSFFVVFMTLGSLSSLAFGFAFVFYIVTCHRKRNQKL